MTDAHHLLDLAVRQYNEVADGVEKHFETVAAQLREWVPTASLLPIQPPARPPPPPPTLLSLGPFARLHRWLSAHQALTAGILAFLSSGAVYLLVQQSASRGRRRARRAANGGRTELVVLVGSTTSALTTELALDLDRRGFIVHLVASSEEDEQVIRSLSRIDIMPLLLDPTDQEGAAESIRRLKRHIRGPTRAGVTLAGVVLVSETDHATSHALTAVDPKDWHDAINAQLVGPILTIQHLIPLVTDYGSRIIHLTPSVPAALQLPFQAVENVVTAALDAASNTLAAEVRLQGASFARIRLGRLDLPRASRRNRAEVRGGTPLRDLHDKLFDALVTSRPNRTWHVGRGSLTYELAGALLPTSLVHWMMGVRKPLGKPAVATQAVRSFESEDEKSDGSQWETLDMHRSQMDQAAS